MTPSLRIPTLALPLLLALGGCSDPDNADTPSGVVNGLMVVSTDSTYQSSVVTLVDPATQKVPGGSCLTSANTGGSLSFPLSADLAMPTQPFPGALALILDRTYGTLTWLDPATCVVPAQTQVSWKESGVDKKTGATNLVYKANPHDVALSAGGQLYVSRFYTNPAPSADPADLDEGGDLLILDYKTLGAAHRLDLAPYAVPTAEGLATDPMPDRMVILENRLYVSLNNLTHDFKGAGPGRIVIVDLATDTVSGTIALPGLKNCSALRTVPGSPKALVVACNGFFMDTDQAAASGIAWIDLSTPAPTVTVVPASAFGAPVSGSDLAVVDPQHAYTVVAGNFDGSRADVLWGFDFAGGVPYPMYAGEAAYTLGGLQYHAASQTLFLGDANTTLPGILTFDLRVVDEPLLGQRIDNDPTYHLYPRSVALY